MPNVRMMMNAGRNDDQSDQELIVEIEYIIESIEKSVDRMSVDDISRSNVNMSILCLFTIPLFFTQHLAPPLGGKFVADWLLDFILITTSLVLLSDFLIKGLRGAGNRIRKRKLLRFQVEAGEETARAMRSWIERSDASQRLKHVLKIRTDYLETLLREIDLRGDNVSVFAKWF